MLVYGRGDRMAAPLRGRGEFFVVWVRPRWDGVGLHGSAVGLGSGAQATLGGQGNLGRVIHLEIMRLKITVGICTFGFGAVGDNIKTR
jgi:hypothetical protein